MSENLLLSCPNYPSYLDAYVTTADLQYLRNVPAARMLVKLNYRSNVSIYSKEDFIRKRQQVLEQFAPEKHRIMLFSWGVHTKDRILNELMAREKPNKQKTLSSIIHLRYYDKNGFEISGFIDYAASLEEAAIQTKDCTNWVAVFEERVPLRPTRQDLSLFDWHKNHSYFNNTANYIVEHDVRGLVFMHRGDRKRLYVDSKKQNWKENGYSRDVYHSELYGDVIIFDHVVRKKI